MHFALDLKFTNFLVKLNTFSLKAKSYIVLFLVVGIDRRRFRQKVLFLSFSK